MGKMDTRMGKLSIQFTKKNRTVKTYKKRQKQDRSHEKWECFLEI